MSCWPSGLEEGSLGVWRALASPQYIEYRNRNQPVIYDCNLSRDLGLMLQCNRIEKNGAKR